MTIWPPIVQRESTQCLWITPGSRESPGVRVLGREQGKTALRCWELSNRRRERPRRAKDQRQTQIRSYTNATPRSNLGEMERGPWFWVTGPVHTIGKRSGLEKNKARNNFKASQSKIYKQKNLRAKSKPQGCLCKPSKFTYKRVRRALAWPRVSDQGCPLQPIELSSGGSPGVHLCHLSPWSSGMAWL